MSLEIVPVIPQDFSTFTDINLTGFDDKFPYFFQGLSREEYSPLVLSFYARHYDLNTSANIDPGLYIVKNHTETIGAIQLGFVGHKRFGFPFIRNLIASKLHGLQAFRTSLIGFIDTHPSVAPDSVLIERIAVVPEWHHRGVGMQIMQFVESLARKRGLKRLILHVIERNTHAIHLYEKQGYQCIKKQYIPFVKRILRFRYLHIMEKHLITSTL